jgi:hypothetical protein
MLASDIDEIATPAIIRADHVRDRPLSVTAGAAIAWRRLSPLEAAYERGQLGGGSPKYDGQKRLAAGEAYARLYARSQASGRDSTDFDRISGGSGMCALSEGQARASQLLSKIEQQMNSRDRLIVRMVCGEGYFPSEAVRTACNDYRHTVASRFREALDSLIEAMENLRRPKALREPLA